MKKTISFLALLLILQNRGFGAINWMPLQVIHEGEILVRDSHSREREEKVYEDVDGDGKNEIIVRFRAQKDEIIPLAVTAIYEIQEGKKVLSKSFLGGETPQAMELFDVDNDGIKDIIVYDHAGMHCTYVSIYSYKGGDYITLFNEGTPCFLFEVDTSSRPVTITIGRENWADEKFCYANSDERSLKEVYIWNGKEFTYSSDLSTTPYIGQEQAVKNTVSHIKKLIKKAPFGNNAGEESGQQKGR